MNSSALESRDLGLAITTLVGNGLVIAQEYRALASKYSMNFDGLLASYLPPMYLLFASAYLFGTAVIVIGD